MSGYIKLTEAPTLTIRHPDCNACDIEVESDGDGWICPCCGTTWSYNGGEDEPGTLYEEWAGEPADGPAVKNDEAWRNGADYKAEQLADTLRRIAQQRLDRAEADVKARAAQA